MSKDIQLHVPNITNFDVKYYFSQDESKQPEKIWPFHLHDRIELYILLEGDVSFLVESSLYKLSSGDAIITKPNEMHNCILNSSSVHRHLCFWFDASSDFIFKDFLSHELGKNNLIVPDDDAKKTLLSVYKQLEEASDKDDRLEQFRLTLEMLSILKRFLNTDAPKQQFPEILNGILNDIDENFKTIKSLDYFKDKYFISASTLNRLFKKHLNTTPKMYLESKRLAHSQILLKEGKSVLDACMESGFSDYSNYIRLFKRRFLITPKQYQDSK